MKWFAAIVSLVVLTLITIGVSVFYYELPLQTVAVNTGLLAGIITGVGVIVTKLVKPAFAVVRDGTVTVMTLVRDAARLLEVHRSIDLPSLANSVNSILAELRPNGGSSVRDAINRIEDRGIRTERVNFAVRQDSPFGIFICDKSGSNREVNRTYSRWLGVGADELLGHGWRNYVIKDASSFMHDEEWVEAFNQGREIEFELTMKSSHHATIKVEIKAHPIHNRNNEVVEYVGVIRKVE